MPTNYLEHVKLGDETGSRNMNRLVAATVEAAAGCQEIRKVTALSADVAWLVNDALDGPQPIGTSWDSPVLALSLLVSELN